MSSRGSGTRLRGRTYPRCVTRPTQCRGKKALRLMNLALLRLLRFVVLGFRNRLPLLADQGCQNLSERKLVSDGLDNVLQFIFATSKGAFVAARRYGEIKRVVPNRMPWEALFQKLIFVGRQNKKEVANTLSHSNHRVNTNSGE